MSTTTTFRFDDYVTHSRRKDGTHVYRCKRNLWAVEGMDLDLLRREACRYWVQYLLGGEYGPLPEVTA